LPLIAVVSGDLAGRLDLKLASNAKNRKKTNQKVARDSRVVNPPSDSDGEEMEELNHDNYGLELPMRAQGSSQTSAEVPSLMPVAQTPSELMAASIFSTVLLITLLKNRDNLTPDFFHFITCVEEEHGHLLWNFFLWATYKAYLVPHDLSRTN
jgi:hypothetical protein